MARRSKDWDENMQEDLNDPSFSGELLKVAVEDGVPLREAIADLVRGIGIKEFAQKIGMSSPNVVRALDPKSNPTEETLARLLAPFELRLGVVPNERRKTQRRRPPRRPS